MPTLTQLTPNLWITQSTLFATNSGIFINGDRALLIDPGIPPQNTDAIAQFVADRGAMVQAIVITHAHWDHILGPEHFPGLPVIAQARYLDVLDVHGSDLKRQVEDWASQNWIRRAQPFVPPVPTYAFDTELTLTLGELRLRLIHTPGHTPDQCVIYHEASGTLWAADMLTDTEVPFIGHSLDAFAETLDFLATLDIRVLIPGHGNPATDAAEIRTRISEDRAYLAALRECVIAAVTSGATLPGTVAACAGIPYPRPCDVPYAHEWNVETAYVEFGGEAEGVVGWDREWLE